MPKYLLKNQTTARLIFRKLELSDFNDWLPFYHNPKSTQYWEGLPTDPIKACRTQFDRVFERYKNDLGGMNALISKETGELIGICGLLVQIVDKIPELEIGYSILLNSGYRATLLKPLKNVRIMHLPITLPNL